LAEDEEIRKRRVEGQRKRHEYERGEGPAYEAAVKKQEQQADQQARQILEDRGLKGQGSGEGGQGGGGAAGQGPTQVIFLARGAGRC